MKIGNIIHSGKLVNHTKSEYINYYDGRIPYGDVDTTLPTLYVGWGLLKDTNHTDVNVQSADILNHEIISKKLYWVFSYQENKITSVNSINRFIEKVPEYYYCSDSEYINIDPVVHQIKDEGALFKLLPDTIDACYVYKGRMCYLLEKGVTNRIYGVDLDMFKFFGFNINNIKLRINKDKPKIFDDKKGKILLEHQKNFTNFPLIKRYIALILSK